MQNVLAVVLGGGKGTRLFPLTQFRSKPAVPLAGKYRIIDIPISNCLNSGLNRIYLLTQFNSVSLHQHIRQTYRFDRFDGGFVEILAAQQTMEGEAWYQGTADAVRKNLNNLRATSRSNRRSGRQELRHHKKADWAIEPDKAPLTMDQTPHPRKAIGTETTTGSPAASTLLKNRVR